MIKFISGSANLPLAQAVAQELNLPLAQAQVVRFDNSEVKVTIKETVKNQTCVILQPTSNPTDTHLNELFFFCDALKRQEAKKVIGVIPYFGYARQDIQHQPGECVSATVVIKFLETIGFDKIYTLNLHDEATQGVFSIPYKNIEAFAPLVEAIKNYLGNEVNNCQIVSPDQGGIERARKFGEIFFGKSEFPLGVIEKKRNLQQIHTSTAISLYAQVEGKTVILVDDIITSGKTLIHAANLCLQQGARRVIAAIVHHDFSPTAPVELEKSPLEKIFSTNTILLKKDQAIAKLEEVSVAPIIAQELKFYLE